MPTQRKTKTKPSQTQSNLLLSVARKSAGKYRKTQGCGSWFDALARRSPKTAEELRQMALNWIGGGETRDLLPQMSDFHRFVVAEVTKVSRCAFGGWLKKLED